MEIQPDESVSGRHVAAHLTHAQSSQLADTHLLDCPLVPFLDNQMFSFIW